MADAHVQILAQGRQLQITDTQLDDDARYTCIGTNPIGAIDLDTFVQVTGTELDSISAIDDLQVLH